MAEISLAELILNSFTIYLLASLETLLSCSAVDKFSHEKKHDSNQELIGQGLGNISVSLFGGIPVTGVIARSATNVRAGAKTRRASIIHSLIIVAAVFALAPLIALVPIAALAAVLFSVALSMMNYHEFKEFLVTTPAEAIIYIITFLAIIFVDLLAGVQAGIIAACLIVLWQATKNNLHISTASEDGVLRLSLSGPLTFLSTGNLTRLEEQLRAENNKKTVLLDLSRISNLDSSGATAIIDLLNFCQETQVKFFILGLSRRYEPLLKMCGDATQVERCFIISEHDLKTKNIFQPPRSFRGRLVHGVQQFYRERKRDDKRLFQYISRSQNPHTLFITCSDSRMVPSLITSADPGELFTVRNVGNSIPAYNPKMCASEAAAIEFALTNLDITDIVICGHANCGAIKACQYPDSVSKLPQLASWITMIRSQLKIDLAMSLDQVARLNVLNQVANIKEYPVVRDKLAKKALSIHAWFFDLDQSLMYEWNAVEASFKPLIATEKNFN